MTGGTQKKKKKKSYKRAANIEKKEGSKGRH